MTDKSIQPRCYLYSTELVKILLLVCANLVLLGGSRILFTAPLLPPMPLLKARPHLRATLRLAVFVTTWRCEESGGPICKTPTGPAAVRWCHADCGSN